MNNWICSRVRPLWELLADWEISHWTIRGIKVWAVTANESPFPAAVFIPATVAHFEYFTRKKTVSDPKGIYDLRGNSIEAMCCDSTACLFRIGCDMCLASRKLSSQLIAERDLLFRLIPIKKTNWASLFEVIHVLRMDRVRHWSKAGENEEQVLAHQHTLSAASRHLIK